MRNQTESFYGITSTIGALIATSSFPNTSGSPSGCSWWIAEFGNATWYGGESTVPGATKNIKTSGTTKTTGTIKSGTSLIKKFAGSTNPGNLYTPASDSAMQYAVEYYYRIVLLTCNDLSIGIPYPWQHSDVSFIGLNNPATVGLAASGPAYSFTTSPAFSFDEYSYGLFRDNGISPKLSAQMMALAWKSGLSAIPTYRN